MNNLAPRIYNYTVTLVGKMRSDVVLLTPCTVHNASHKTAMKVLKIVVNEFDAVPTRIQKKDNHIFCGSYTSPDLKIINQDRELITAEEIDDSELKSFNGFSKYILRSQNDGLIHAKGFVSDLIS